MKLRLLPNDIDTNTLMQNLKIHKEGIALMQGKCDHLKFYVKDIRTPAANILKQDALSVGAEFAVPCDTVCCKSDHADGILMGTRKQLEILCEKESAQPFGLKTFSEDLRRFLQMQSTSDYVRIMGVINANDDSFYSGSRFKDEDAIRKIESLIEEGADTIDIGGVSSRPGSAAVSEEEEWSRLAPVIKAIYDQKLTDRAIFSIDSHTPSVLKKCLDSGFSFINDITGLHDEAVAKLAGEYDAEVCIMHMQGTPQTMQQNPEYTDVVDEIDLFFEERIKKALDFGITKILLDPGIGFGKTITHNLLILKHLSHFRKHGCPILIAASRKSLIDKVIPAPVEERLPGTLAIHLHAVREGASVLRVHDVKEHVQALKIQHATEGMLL